MCGFLHEIALVFCRAVCYNKEKSSGGMTLKEQLGNLPAFEGYGFYTHGAYEEEDGGVTYGLAGVSVREAKAYLAALAAAGFSEYTANRIGTAEFHTLTRGEEQVRFAYFPLLCLLKLYVTVGQLLPAVALPAYEKRVSVSITQIGRRGTEQPAPGMSYILQAEDGSFVVIDGGGYDQADEAELFAFLSEHTPGGGKPVIAVWMLTHPHPDHMALAEHFLADYAGQVELRMAAYNFPDLSKVTVPHEDLARHIVPHVERFRRALREGFPEAKTYVFHTGDTLYLPGLRMDFLFTHEDYYPHEFSWVNHLSAAWMVRGSSRTALILGDCEKGLCQQMASAYGDALKCDILQPTHHGANGACMDIYRYADPDVCLWAIDEARFSGDARMLGQKKGYEFNAFLRNPSIKERTHYHSSVTKTLLL